MRFFVLLSLVLFTAQIDNINYIKEQFKQWQPILHDSTSKSLTYYHVIWGKNYENEKWIENIEDSSVFVDQGLDFFKNTKLGYVIKRQETSPSGDWFINSEHYFYPNGNLYFIFWSMNTFYSEFPLTVERRLYFDREVTLIKKLESVYEMNTKNNVENINYYDKDVNYWKNVKQIKFLKSEFTF